MQIFNLGDVGVTYIAIGEALVSDASERANAAPNGMIVPGLYANISVSPFGYILVRSTAGSRISLIVQMRRIVRGTLLTAERSCTSQFTATPNNLNSQVCAVCFFHPLRLCDTNPRRLRLCLMDKNCRILAFLFT